MTRVLSALVILPLVIGVIWFLPATATLVLGQIVLLVAFVEYASLAARLDARVPLVPAGAATAAVCAAVGWPGAVEAVLMAALIMTGVLTLGAAGREEGALRDVGATMFAPLYLGLPIGALVAVRIYFGREALMLLLITIMASDTFQYYGGRTFGRHLLAPAISPKKTIEGAIAGLLAGPSVMLALGRGWLPGTSIGVLALLGVAVAALGIGGDLFESRLKRSAGVKDASALIPGHGGMLDRIDGLLLAAPVYYVYLQLILSESVKWRARMCR